MGPPKKLLDVLNLLAQFLQLALEVNDNARELDVLRLRPHGVDLAVQLLTEKIELAADRRGPQRTDHEPGVDRR